MQSFTYRQWTNLFGVASFVVPMVLFIITLPQDLVWGDSPELAASAWILGVPHPTGYSFYMLIGHCFQLLPFGTIIFRTHLMSALFSACACLVLYHTLRRLLNRLYPENVLYSAYPAWLATLAYTLTPLVRTQSIVTEVYPLLILLTVLTLWLFINALSCPGRCCVALSFVIGLSITHHRLSLLLLVCLMVVVLLRLIVYPNNSFWNGVPHTANPPSATDYFYSVVAFLAPLALLAYFPIRAAQQPAINWYDPITWERWYLLISGDMYAHIIPNFIRNATYSVQINGPYPMLSNYLYYLGLPMFCYSGAALLILVGWISSFRRMPWLAFLSLILFGSFQTFVFAYRVGDWPVFLMPALAFAVFPLAFAISSLLRSIDRFGNSPSLKKIIILSLLPVMLTPMAVKFDEQDGILEYPLNLQNYLLDTSLVSKIFSSLFDRSANEYANAVWHTVPDRAPIVTGLYENTADNELYPLLYQQIVEKRGRSNTIVGAGFIYLDWYRRSISSSLDLPLASRNDAPHRNREEWLEDTWDSLIAPLLDRGPVYSTSYPLPEVWQNRYRREAFRYEIDRAAIPYAYRPFIPKGTIHRLEALP